MDPQASLRKHALELLEGKGAHPDFEAAVADLPVPLRGVKPDRLPHSPWRLVEHMRIAQRDILDFSRDGRHVSPDFPDGYWPDGNAPPDPHAWDRTLDAFRDDLKAMRELVSDPKTDLLAVIPHAPGGQTVLREALLVADHNGYHVGQLVIVRRLLGAWHEG